VVEAKQTLASTTPAIPRGITLHEPFAPVAAFGGVFGVPRVYPID